MLIKGIRKRAVSAMDQSATEVNNGVVKANKAGNVLSDILKAAEAVNEQKQQPMQLRICQTPRVS